VSQSVQVISAPFVEQGNTVGSVMRQVIYALIPGILVAFYYFGWGVITNITLAVLTALFWEAAMLLLRDRPVKLYLADGSAILTAILLALALPPMAPWWLILVGTFIAIVVAKQLYGGLGYNPLNPAMAGYAVLLISFPLNMSIWPAPVVFPDLDINFQDAIYWVFFQEFSSGLKIDAVTAATPLDQLRTEISRGLTLDLINKDVIYGLFAGKAVEWINVGFLLGGLWLFYKRLITWHIPVSIILTIAAFSSVFYFYAPDQYADPLFHLFSGATMLCVFFIATDPVSAATTPLGKIIYGIGIGFLIFIIRTWGGYPDAVAFAVLLMNLTAPLLDYYTVPRAFGARISDAEKR
jgi:Na+-translocating ferredoxin:NAD+ oxidoreductase subunit D